MFESSQSKVDIIYELPLIIMVHRRTIENERNAFVAKNNCLSRLCLFFTLFFNFFLERKCNNEIISLTEI